jgi:alpha-D-ribose 1-methylphosphonate 5-triphosphate synthase subunit PhnG
MPYARERRGRASEKSSFCHETVMARHYQVVYYHRQLASGKAQGTDKVDMTAAQDASRQVQRKAAMAVLAHSDAAAIAGHLGTIAIPAHENLREPENGIVMIRGRIGGDGTPFNLGEATVSRAAVRLASGVVGFGYTLGRDWQKARMIALCDALLQSDDFADAVEANVLAPLRSAMASERNRKAEETAATRVDFYTLVRGEG